MIGVLRLREFDRVRIGARWHPTGSPAEVPESFAGSLESLQRRLGIDAFDVGRRAIQASNHVGTLSVGGRTVDVLPKIDTLDDSRVRDRLVEMLTVAGMIPNFEAGLADLNESAPSLLDLYMGLYVRHLRTEWRRGQIRAYCREDLNRTALKGKLLIPGQIRQNLLHPERFYTRADTFTSDVAASRLLKAGLRSVQVAAHQDSLRREAVQLLHEFEEVDDVEYSNSEAERVTVTRQHERFDPLLVLARLLIGTRSPDAYGNRETCALLFDMNIVFERYVGELLRCRVCPRLGLHAKLQIRGASLLLHGTRPCFHLRPDIGIYEGNRLLVIIDTKWKRLDPTQERQGVSQADAYQAYAYGKEYRAPLVILLYPDAGVSRWSITSLRHHGEEPRRMEISSVCMADSVSATTNALADCLARCLSSSR